MTLIIDLAVIMLLIAGIRQFREPRAARFGNLIAAVALLCALILILLRNGIDDGTTVGLSLLIGAIFGVVVAKAVTMIHIPAMVAFQHGAGGVAAFLVSLVELMRGADSLAPAAEISGLLGLTLGALTFSGSMVASAKLANKIRQAPQIWPGHNFLVWLTVAIMLAVGTTTLFMPPPGRFPLYGLQIFLAVCFGILFSARIGGADMPVLISFLNATAGLAAAFCGMALENRLLIAFGATVAASGSILTHVMCMAMNRSLAGIFRPKQMRPQTPPAVERMQSVAADSPAAAPPDMRNRPDALTRAVEVIRAAQRVIVIPGYGIALAKAQFKVVELAAQLTRRGAVVKYAIHPVAGRMPGHMNVILAEAEVDYDDLLEMDEANPMFPATDVALIVGACDVVNPEAMRSEGTPISGMPILTAHAAKKVVVCNLDPKPGYSGVPNPLYEDGDAIMLLGDALKTISDLVVAIQATKVHSHA